MIFILLPAGLLLLFPGWSIRSEETVLLGLFGGPWVVREVGEKYASSAKHFAGLGVYKS